LKKFEKMSILNLQFLSDNLEFIQEWLNFLKTGQSYSFHFGHYIINYEEVSKLSNIDLINKVMYLNYKLERINFDFDNFYKGRQENVLKINSMEKEQKLVVSSEYNKIVSQWLEKMENDRTFLENELIDVIANIRVVANAKSQSFFGYLNFLFIHVYPRITQEKIEIAIKNLKKEIAEKTRGI